MDSFRDLIEADSDTFLGAVGAGAVTKISDKGKETANRFLKGLGSARASGRLDLGLVITDLRNQWKYYISQQQLTPSPASMVDFLQTVFGMDMTVDQVSNAIYGEGGQKPQIMAPHKAVLDDKFAQLQRARGNTQSISQAATELAQYAENNDGDQGYIVAMLKFLGSKQSPLLTNPAMGPLQPYMHGGRMSDQDVEKILTMIAKILLKKQIIIQRMAQSQAADPNGDAEAGDSQDAGVSSTPGEISINPPSKQEKPNWGGLIMPTSRSVVASSDVVLRNMKSLKVFKYNFVDIFKVFQQENAVVKFNTALQSANPKIVNATSAQFMQYIVRNTTLADFVAVMAEQQEKNGGISWPKQNMIAAYAFIHAGGIPDEVTAELNHFVNNPKKAALILTTLLSLAAKEWQRQNGGTEAPAAAPQAAPTQAAPTQAARTPPQTPPANGATQ